MLSFAPYMSLLDTDEEQAAFLSFFRRYHRFVLKKAKDIVKTQERAEDVGQEVFLYALQHFEKFQGRETGEVMHYLMLCTASRAAHYLAQEQKEQRIALEEQKDVTACVDEAEQIVLRRDTAARALAAVRALPERYRTPLELRLNGERYEEIAALLALPRDTVYKRVQRAYQNVRERLVSEDGE